MTTCHLDTAEIELLLSDSASSKGNSEEYVPDRRHEESSAEHLSNIEEYEPPSKRKKRSDHKTKDYNHVEDTNVISSKVQDKHSKDEACHGRQQPEPRQKWTAPNIVQPVLPPFIATWGCRVNTQNFSPIDYFQLYLDNDFLQNVVKQTNLHAVRYFAEQDKKQGGCAEDSHWTPTNLSEMRKFWGLTLQMGIAQKPSIEVYWSPKNPLISHIFLATMSRNRFLLLQKFLCFNDSVLALPPNHRQFDDLFKLRPFLDHLQKRFQEVYTPGQNLVVDRSLLSYKGHIVSEEFSKKEKYWELHRLCESSSGYTYGFRVCTHKALDHSLPECPSDLGINEKIVEDLVHPLYNQGYHLYMSHMYSSTALFRYLYMKGTLACGTFHPFKKGFPQKLKIRKHKKGENSLRRSGELLAVRYKGGQDLLLLTTIHDESTLAFAMVEEQNVTKPKCLSDYKYYVAGVERARQMLDPFIAHHKTMVWYKRLAVYLVKLSMFNAYVVYFHTSSGKHLSLLSFQEQVIKSLLEIEQVSLVVPKARKEERLVGRHFPDLLPPNKNMKPMKRCQVCFRNGRRRNTRYHCPDCPAKPGLCLKKCFRTYHTDEIY